MGHLRFADEIVITADSLKEVHKIMQELKQATEGVVPYKKFEILEYENMRIEGLKFISF